MARIRTIKPEFFTSVDIVELEPMARLLYIALWCEADREGRLSWNPKTFKIRYFPMDNCNIDALCDALLTRGLCVMYASNLAFIPSFGSHQHINPRESESRLPAPTQCGIDEFSRVTHASPRVTNATVTHREEGKGKEGKHTRQSRETTIPENFAISDSVRDWAEKNGYHSLEIHHSNFVDACLAKGYKYANWDAAFRNAIKKNWAGVGAKPANSKEEFSMDAFLTKMGL